MSNKKRNILLGVGLGILILAAIIYAIVTNLPKTEETKVNMDISIPTVKIDNSTLPDFEKVDIDKEPLMYDFLYGALDWHTKAPVPALSTSVVYEVCKDTVNNRFYITYSTPGESSTNNSWNTPSYGNNPIEIDSFISNKEERAGFLPSTFTTDLANYAYTEKEGNYEFSWFWQNNETQESSEGFQNYSSWCGLDLTPVINNQDIGILHKEINSGMGIPTQYLRASSAEAAKLAELDSVYIEDKFWDDANYKSRLKGKKVKFVTDKSHPALTDDVCWISPVAFKGGEHSYYWDVNDSGEKYLSDRLEDYGYQSVDTIKNNQSYMSLNDLDDYYKYKTKSSS